MQDDTATLEHNLVVSFKTKHTHHIIQHQSLVFCELYITSNKKLHMDVL